MINFEFKSVIELVKAFPTQEVCIKHLEELRWNGNVVSPFDATSKVYKCAGNKYKCKNTGKYFNVCTATLFDNTKIELPTWFLAIYLITSHKKGISSIQLAKDLNVTQKTAWFMNHRIRACFGITDTDNEDGKVGGGGQIVEVDETYVGGKMKNMHHKKRRAIGQKGANANKSMVMGYLVRGGNLRMQVVTDKKTIFKSVLENVNSESVLLTDMNGSYHYASNHFLAHETVDHTRQEFVRNGTIHTNSIEGVFSMFDRMVIGTYHFISQKHMQKYANELTFRYNSRDMKENARFTLLLTNMSNRLTYNTLIAK
ncbi:MAG: IS1595 family transposase [Flavipsychrobacter sp.]|nr:IS1595 family transposase [Flavipsychrobacter sp.]